MIWIVNEWKYVIVAMMAFVIGLVGVFLYVGKARIFTWREK